jgi:hypothetical protein
MKKEKHLALCIKKQIELFDPDKISCLKYPIVCDKLKGIDIQSFIEECKNLGVIVKHNYELNFDKKYFQNDFKKYGDSLVIFSESCILNENC